MKAIFIYIALLGFTLTNTLASQKKAPVRIYLEQFRSQDEIQLSVRVLAKTEKRYLPLAGAVVLLYTSEISDNNFLGEILTNEMGKATYTLNQEQFEFAKITKEVMYYAVINENETLSGKKTSMLIKQVKLDVRFTVEDSIKQIHAYITESDSAGNDLPQAKVQIKFLVDRPLSPLPIGEEVNKTNEAGSVSTEFPDDLPGDAEGNLKVLVRIVENDDYGTVEVSEIKPWGIATVINDYTLKRSLWASSANAPISLLIFINSLIIGVWGTIFYIVYKINQIRKIGKS